jgi:hypothetical protein
MHTRMVIAGLRDGNPDMISAMGIVSKWLVKAKDNSQVIVGVLSEGSVMLPSRICCTA